jgi:hypothetical protein
MSLGGGKDRSLMAIIKKRYKVMRDISGAIFELVITVIEGPKIMCISDLQAREKVRRAICRSMYPNEHYSQSSVSNRGSSENFPCEYGTAEMYELAFDEP